MSEKDTIVLAALLHDIGKLVQRAHDQPTKMTHQEFGAEWLRENGISDAIASIVERHHLLKGGDPKYEDLDASVSNPTLIVCEADWLSARERPEKEVASEEEAKWVPDVPLLSIFTRVHLSSKESSVGYLEPLPLSEKLYYPKTEVTLDKGKYKDCLQNLKADLEKIKDSLTVNNLLVLLEKHTSFIPSETRVVKGKVETYPDISLFDHLKATGAIAKVMDLYVAENYSEEYKRNQILKEVILNDNDAKFLLIGGDFSGVQKFIYTISSKGALKTLRARSFFLELLTEHVINQILEELRLTRANIIYSGGGRFYILASNTDSAKKKLNDIQKEINRWLFEQFRGNLYLAMETAKIRGKDLRLDKISKVWSDLATKIAKSKSHKFITQLQEILSPSEPKLPGEKCSVCYRDDIDEKDLKPLHKEEPENLVCPFCRMLFNLGDALIDAKFIGRTSNEAPAEEYYVKVQNLYYVPLKERRDRFDVLYVINNWDLDSYKMANAIPLLVGNYVRKACDLPGKARESKDLGPTANFGELAKASRGANRIGVLRMDVDNLGRIFAQGFEEELRTFSRLASLSRQLTMFFKFYINSICQGELGEELEPLDLSEKEPSVDGGRNLHIIYSGGDDLFIVGAWDEVTEIAFDIHKSFKQYTCKNKDVNISGGVVVQSEDYPLYLLADLAGEAEELAKRAGRNRITLFYNPGLKAREDKTKNIVKQVFDWDRVDDEVIEPMKTFKAIGRISEEENRFEPGFAHRFLYKLFSIYEQWEREGIMYLPRMGYAYRRLQEVLRKEKKTPELEKLENILMDKDKIINLRTSLMWIEFLSRKVE